MTWKISSSKKFVISWDNGVEMTWKHRPKWEEPVWHQLRSKKTKKSWKKSPKKLKNTSSSVVVAIFFRFDSFWNDLARDRNSLRVSKDSHGSLGEEYITQKCSSLVESLPFLLIWHQQITDHHYKRPLSPHHCLENIIQNERSMSGNE